MGYINSVTKRFHVFVANRVQQIHEHTQAFFFLKCFILQNKTHNRDKTKDSTYNIKDTKEKNSN